MATYPSTGTASVYYTVTTGILTNTVTLSTTNPATTASTIATFTGVPSGNIVTGSTGITSLISLLASTFVSVPGATGSITVAASLLSGLTFVVGGTTTISTALSAASAITVDVYGGTATFSSGQVASALSGSTINIGYGGTYASGSNLASILSGTTINFVTGGGTLILNGGSTLIDLSSTTITGYNPTSSVIELQNTTATISGYTIAAGSTSGSRVITLYSSGGTEVATYTVTLASGVTLATGTYTTGSSNNPLSITYVNGNTYIGTCYLAGSMIRTPDGDKAVEDITIGDVLVAFDNGQEVLRDVIWTGRTHAAVNPALPDDEAGYPVRVRANAIADGVPFKDLLITPEHCLFVDGRFVPVRTLVNGRSITYDRSITDYDYYHVETADHSVIMADGMLSESYLDTGNRRTFRQDGTVATIGGAPKSWAQDAAAPLDVSRDFIEPLYERLAKRAATPADETAAPRLTTDANLHLVTPQGHVIRKVRESNGRSLFMIPGGVETVQVVSRTSRPCDVVGPFVDDRRHLGVLIGEVTLFASGMTRQAESHLTDETLSGWSCVEASRCRWTMGNAELPLGPRKPNSIVMLAIQVLAAGPYLEEENVSNVSVATA